MDGINWEYKRYYALIYPLMWIIAVWVAAKKFLRRSMRLPPPRVNSLFFDGLGKVCQEIKDNATKWRSIDLICGYPFLNPRNWIELLETIWLNTPNCQALRNRLKVVTREVVHAIWRISLDTDEEIRILSLASGSGTSVLSAMGEALQKRVRGRQVRVRCLLIDMDASAGVEAMHLAEGMGIGHLVEFQTMQITMPKLRKLLATFKPDIVEMVGLIDYLQDRTIKSFTRTIGHQLPPNGRFITATIVPCPAQLFLRLVVNWDMKYRTGSELKRVLEEVEGYENVWCNSEPWGIYAVAVCEKPGINEAQHFVEVYREERVRISSVA